MKTNNINKILINLNIINISFIIIISCYLLLSIYYINIFIILITLLILKLMLKNSNISLIKVAFISIFIYFYFHNYLINNVIYLDSTEYLILYNNIYIKGLNSLIENYGELIAYAVGVKLSSIYLKILPADPIFYFYFGLGLGPSLTLTVHKEEVSSIGLSNNSTNSVLLNIQSADSHVDFLKDMVPRYYQYYHTTKMTNFENNTIILSGNAPTNINCPLENADLINSTYLNFFNLIEALNNDFLIILFLFLLVIFFILSFIFYKIF